MTLIATPSATDANSYVTVARAKVILNERLDGAEWIAAPVTEQEQSLIWATRLINQKTQWELTPTTTTQALWFPVSDGYDMHGVLWASTIIPGWLEWATAVYALYLWRYTKHARDERLTRLDLGPVNMQFEPGGPSPADVLPAEIRSVLAIHGVVSGGSGMIPVYRV